MYYNPLQEKMNQNERQRLNQEQMVGFTINYKIISIMVTLLDVTIKQRCSIRCACGISLIT